MPALKIQNDKNHVRGTDNHFGQETNAHWGVGRRQKASVQHGHDAAFIARTHGGRTALPVQNIAGVNNRVPGKSAWIQCGMHKISHSIDHYVYVTHLWCSPLQLFNIYISLWDANTHNIWQLLLVRAGPIVSVCVRL